MITYWSLFLLPAGVVLFLGNYRAVPLLWTFAVIATMVLGLRYEIGADWLAYLDIFDQAEAAESLFEALAFSDPGYMAVNWLSAQIGSGISGVNLFGSWVLLYGLVRLCREQPFPWLGIIVAVPYLLIVVGMGYSRQAVAIGFVCWALSIWRHGNVSNYAVLILLAMLFHKSAIVMLLPGILLLKRENLYNLVLLMVLPSLFFLYFAYDLLVNKINVYFISGYFFSDGAVFRALLNVIPGILLLLRRRGFRRFDDHRLWSAFVYATTLAVATLLVVPEWSTVIDRFALYLIPLQIVVYARFPALIKNSVLRSSAVLSIIVFYAAILFVWLNFADHAYAWVPYQWKVW